LWVSTDLKPETLITKGGAKQTFYYSFIVLLKALAKARVFYSLSLGGWSWATE